MNKTSIEWTDYSANLIRYKDQFGKDVWACAKTSPGCAHCYSEATAHRYKRGGPFTLQQVREVTPYFAEDEAKKILRSKSLSGKKVFIGDMTDVFGDWVPDDLLDKMFAVFALRQDVIFQVLTKRADRMAAYIGGCVENGKLRGSLSRAAMAVQGNEIECDVGGPNGFHRFACVAKGWPWPLKNVWLGFSAENQEHFDKRAAQTAQLMRDGWTVFVSAEPLLGPITMRNWLGETGGISWVIVGGESGHGARDCDLAWPRSIIKQCKAASVPVFMKQLGSKVIAANDQVADWFDACPHLQMRETERFQGAAGHVVGFKDRKGGKPAEWPIGLLWREFPEVRS